MLLQIFPGIVRGLTEAVTGFGRGKRAEEEERRRREREQLSQMFLELRLEDLRGKPKRERTKAEAGPRLRARRGQAADVMGLSEAGKAFFMETGKLLPKLGDEDGLTPGQELANVRNQARAEARQIAAEEAAVQGPPVPARLQTPGGLEGLPQLLEKYGDRLSEGELFGFMKDALDEIAPEVPRPVKSIEDRARERAELQLKTEQAANTLRGIPNFDLLDPGFAAPSDTGPAPVARPAPEPLDPAITQAAIEMVSDIEDPAERVAKLRLAGFIDDHIAEIEALIAQRP